MCVGNLHLLAIPLVLKEMLTFGLGGVQEAALAGRASFLARLAMIICLASLMDFLWYPAECFDDKAPLQNCKK